MTTRRTNPAYKIRMVLRKRIQVSTRLLVEPVDDAPDKERLVCKKCGWTLVQNVGGMSDKQLANSNKRLIAKLIAYRGDGRETGHGIWGVCDGCTQKRRDEAYPLTGISRYL